MQTETEKIFTERLGKLTFPRLLISYPQRTGILTLTRLAHSTIFPQKKPRSTKEKLPLPLSDLCIPTNSKKP